MDDNPEGRNPPEVELLRGMEDAQPSIVSHPTHIQLTGIQVRSVEKARKLAQALAVIEQECGLLGARVTITNCYVADASGIDAELNGTPMECIVRRLLLDESTPQTSL